MLTLHVTLRYAAVKGLVTLCFPVSDQLWDLAHMVSQWQGSGSLASSESPIMRLLTAWRVHVQSGLSTLLTTILSAAIPEDKTEGAPMAGATSDAAECAVVPDFPKVCKLLQNQSPAPSGPEVQARSSTKHCRRCQSA